MKPTQIPPTHLRNGKPVEEDGSFTRRLDGTASSGAQQSEGSGGYLLSEASGKSVTKSHFLIYNPAQTPEFVWSPKKANATEFSSQSEAEKVKRLVMDATAIVQVNGKWLVVKG